MRYKRNSTLKKNSKQLTNIQLTEIGIKLTNDADWLEQLEQTEQFSSEWIHTVAKEILFQCLGKKQIVVGEVGNEKLTRVFKEKHAIKMLEMIAKMNGHLVDSGKLQITQTVNETIEHRVELVADADRTQSVLEILESCDGLKRETKRLTRDDVELISA